MTNIIEIKDLHKKYGNFEALKGINLNLESSQILGFIGPNGAGKTTTIRILLGMLKGEGTANVFGMDAWDKAVDIHKRLSYVPGDVTLWPNLTGGEVIDFFLKLKNQENSPYKNELIKKFDLDITKKCKTYSKGNRQKVALIAALSSDVDLYIFDEPTSGLDPLMESIFQDEVRRLKERGKSILLSSHILSEVEKLCDSICIVKDGLIIESGKLDDMRHLTSTKLKIRTKNPISNLKELPLYNIEEDGDYITFNVDDENLNTVISEISKFDIYSLESKSPTLEEVFMGHYEKE